MTDPTKTSQASTGQAGNAPQSLSQKTDAQIERETRARLKRLDPITATNLFNDVVGREIKGTAHGFVQFLREHAIVGLAVGFVLGTQIQTVVKQLISSFIDPLFQLLGGQALSQRTATWHFHNHGAKLGWGAFVYSLIDFIFVALAVYIIIKMSKLDKLDQPKK